MSLFGLHKKEEEKEENSQPLNSNDDKVFRHLKRTTPDEFLEKLGQSRIHISEIYAKDFLMFNNFCEQNNWTFKEGLILYLEKYYNSEQEKVSKKRDELQAFK